MKKNRVMVKRTQEDFYYSGLYGPAKTHEIPVHTVFLRLNSRHKVQYADRFRKAGYPSAEFKGDWMETHRWCSEKFKDGKGRRTYCWNGNIFWFLNEDDRDKFLSYIESQNAT